MKAINYIIGFGAFAAAVVSAIFCALVGRWAVAVRDLPMAASCCFGIIWFTALAIKSAAWAWRISDK